VKKVQKFKSSKVQKQKKSKSVKMNFGEENFNKSEIRENFYGMFAAYQSQEAEAPLDLRVHRRQEKVAEETHSHSAGFSSESMGQEEQSHQTSEQPLVSFYSKKLAKRVELSPQTSEQAPAGFYSKLLRRQVKVTEKTPAAKSEKSAGFYRAIPVEQEKVTEEQPNISFSVQQVEVVEQTTESQPIAGMSEVKVETDQPSRRRPINLDSEIPINHIECNVDIILAKNVQESLKMMNSSLIDNKGKKFTFRSIIDEASARVAYPPTSELFAADLRSPTETGETTASEPEVALTSTDAETAELQLQRLTKIQESKSKTRETPENVEMSYNANMARSFPGAEKRTAEEELSRKKNTEAARVSRSRTKAVHVKITSDALDATARNIDLKWKLVVVRNIINAIQRKLGEEPTDLEAEYQNYRKKIKERQEATGASPDLPI
jgi:hypothetical protein